MKKACKMLWFIKRMFSCLDEDQGCIKHSRQISPGIWQHQQECTLSDGHIGSGKVSASNNEVSSTHEPDVLRRRISYPEAAVTYILEDGRGHDTNIS